MELRTERLRIRTLRAEDWQEMGEIFADFSRSAYAVYDRPLPVEEGAVRELVRQFAETERFYTVRRADDGQMVGYVCFHRVGEHYDLGYCFHSAAQGQGYAHESVCALLDVLTEAEEVACFTAGTALANRPSCRLLEKLGFACVSTEEVSFDGVFSFTGGNFVRQMQK